MIVARRKYKKIKYVVFKYSKRDKLAKLASSENKDPKKACSLIFRHFFWRIWGIGPMDRINNSISSLIL